MQGGGVGEGAELVGRGEYLELVSALDYAVGSVFECVQSVLSDCREYMPYYLSLTSLVRLLFCFSV